MSTNNKLIMYFNELSDTYATNEYASLFTTNYMRRKLLKKIKSFDNKSVFDIMSGKGENLSYINQNKGNTKITTLDFASKMNDAARVNHKNKTIHQIEDDFFAINHRAESYDIILCSFGIKTIEPKKLDLFAKKLKHMLKPNGEIFLLEIVRPKRNFNFKLVKLYLNEIVPWLYGNQFKALFTYMNNHINMNRLKMNMINEKLNIIEHTRVFDMYEIIHAKKSNT